MKVTIIENILISLLLSCFIGMSVFIALEINSSLNQPVIYEEWTSHVHENMQYKYMGRIKNEVVCLTTKSLYGDNKHYPIYSYLTEVADKFINSMKPKI